MSPRFRGLGGVRVGGAGRVVERERCGEGVNREINGTGHAIL